jgi:hypothetical protein
MAIRIGILLICCLSFSVRASADTVLLKDGRLYSGKMLDQEMEEAEDGEYELDVDDRGPLRYHRIYRLVAPDGTVHSFKGVDVEKATLDSRASTPAAVTPYAITPYANPSENSINSGYIAGRIAAGSHETFGWFVGGFFAGATLGLVGTGVTWVLAGSGGMDLKTHELASIRNRNQQYFEGYTGGYAERIRSKRKGSALSGGLLGTLTFVAIYLNAVN